MNEDYPAFTKWLKILNWILDKCEKFPKDVRYSFCDRIIRISLDLTEKLIEVIYSRDKVQAIKEINLALEKLRIFFRISFQRKYISLKQYEYICEEFELFGKMMGGWLKTCKE